MYNRGRTNVTVVPQANTIIYAACSAADKARSDLIIDKCFEGKDDKPGVQLKIPSIGLKYPPPPLPSRT
jgi:hypothetical protein